MVKYFKNISWSILLLLIYVSFQFLSNWFIKLCISLPKANYSDPKIWPFIFFSYNLLNSFIRFIVPIAFSLILYFLLYRFVLKEKVSSHYGFSKTRVRNIVAGILIGLCLALISTLIFNNQLWYDLIYSNWLHSLNFLFKSHDILIILMNTILYEFIISFPIMILIPIFEEILFRGLILGELNKSLPISVAIFIQSLLFGIMHFSPLNALRAFIIGLLLAFIYKAVKSIWVPIVIHALYNTTILLVQKIYETSSLLNPTVMEPSDIIDTYVNNLLGKNKAGTAINSLPATLNIILILIISSAITILTVYLWKANGLRKNSNHNNFLESDSSDFTETK